MLSSLSSNAASLITHQGSWSGRILSTTFHLIVSCNTIPPSLLAWEDGRREEGGLYDGLWRRTEGLRNRSRSHWLHGAGCSPLPSPPLLASVMSISNETNSNNYRIIIVLASATSQTSHHINQLSPPLSSPLLSFLVAPASSIVLRLVSPRLENNRVFPLILSIFFSLRTHSYLRWFVESKPADI